MPKITTTTRTYKDVISSVRNKDLKITVPKVRRSYCLGKATWEIVAPNGSDYENTNNYSVCIKVTYGNNSFLFTGDAENIIFNCGPGSYEAGDDSENNDTN